MATADIEQLKEYAKLNKPIEYAIEYLYQRPLKECSLKEAIEGIIINANMSKWFDTVGYTDEGDYYMFTITHSLGVNTSRMLELLNGSVFKTYGAKTECTISDKMVFFKIYKTA